MQPTSIEIYHQIKESGLITKLRFRFYDFIYHYGPVTASEIFSQLGLKCNQSGRITELKELGVITEHDTVICPVTHHTAIRWKVTGQLPVKLEKVNPKKSILNKILDLELFLSGSEKEKLNDIYKDLVRL